MNKEKFIELFQETLEMEDHDIKMEDKFRDYEEWDSLAYLSIIAMVDEEFNVIIEGPDFRKLITLQNLYDEIQKRKE